MFFTCVWLVWVLYNQLSTHTYNEKQNVTWHEYNPQVVEKLVANGKPVLVNFTAKWCITCLANEKLAFSSNEFVDLVSNKNIQLFKADWTNENPEITKALAAYGRNSIPLYVYYDGKSTEYKILPQLLTTSILVNYLK